MMPPNHATIRGRAALERYFADLFARSRFEFSFTSSRIEVSGDVAVERVEYRALIRSHDGSAIGDDAGKGVHVFRRQPDGSWKLWQDIWNSDRSASPQPALDAVQTQGESRS